MQNESRLLIKKIVRLGESKKTQNIPELISYLNHPNGNVRRLACSALGKIKNPQAETPLINILDDKKPQVRQYAIIALGKLGSSRSLPKLKKIARQDKKQYNRRAAKKALKKIPKIELNSRFKKALRLMEKTNQHLFITGRAGTGKSTLLEYFRSNSKKVMAVLAPTGVAAVNIQGQTIHSFFGFGPDITPSKVRKEYHNKKKQGLYKKLDTIVIDEVSMVRADLLDCVDEFLRLNAKSKNKPFGGIQMILIGDLYQLPPVVTSVEKMIFKTLYNSPYFFDAHILKDINLKLVELEKIYRQEDKDFIDILNAIRNKTITEADLQKLNRRVQPEFSPPPKDFYIYLTPTNKLADRVNNQRLEKIPEDVFYSQGFISGEFEKNALPTKLDLTLKKRAQVMLVNNDQRGRWINGTVGQIISFKKDPDYEDPIIRVRLENKKRVTVLPHTWEMFEFKIKPKTGKLISETVGSFTQYPLRLAWAITIHKSQGKTFEHTILDIGRGTFAHGQTYVALSRCTSLQGLILKKPLRKKHILMDWRIVRFLTNHKYQQAEKILPAEKKEKIIQSAIKKNQNLKIVYLKTNDRQTERVIEPFTLGKFSYKDKEFFGVKAFCQLRQAERVFRIDRILKITNI